MFIIVRFQVCFSLSPRGKNKAWRRRESERLGKMKERSETERGKKKWFKNVFSLPYIGLYLFLLINAFIKKKVC